MSSKGNGYKYIGRKMKKSINKLTLVTWVIGHMHTHMDTDTHVGFDVSIMNPLTCTISMTMLCHWVFCSMSLFPPSTCLPEADITPSHPCKLLPHSLQLSSPISVPPTIPMSTVFSTTHTDTHTISGFR